MTPVRSIHTPPHTNYTFYTHVLIQGKLHTRFIQGKIPKLCKGVYLATDSIHYNILEPFFSLLNFHAQHFKMANYY